MRESFLNEYAIMPKNEVFANICVPSETPFFLRLDGWKFQKLSESIGAEKPFDRNFAKCLVCSAEAIFKTGFDPALVYVASDELNILFLEESPFNRRVEKIDSVISSLASTAFVLFMEKLFEKKLIAAFDSRVIVVPSENRIIEYLALRQSDLWRNHNNAYAYWLLRKNGYKPSEASKKLKGLKTEELHEIAFKHGVNLAETPAWQRRGILIYKEPYAKRTQNHIAERWKLKAEWNLPLFTSDDGVKLIKQIIEWKRRKRKQFVRATENPADFGVKPKTFHLE
ncbi:MAG: tRNA(His) guanylyltransferase Thg1 family protein, partial [Candidatus Bathyarchaeales archaeon]